MNVLNVVTSTIWRRIKSVSKETSPIAYNTTIQRIAFLVKKASKQLRSLIIFTQFASIWRNQWLIALTSTRNWPTKESSSAPNALPAPFPFSSLLQYRLARLFQRFLTVLNIKRGVPSRALTFPVSSANQITITRQILSPQLAKKELTIPFSTVLNTS